MTDDDRADLAASPFTHAVASFDPTSDGVLLWTRAPGVSSLRWHMAPLASDGRAGERLGTVTLDPAADGCVTVTVDDLAPATSYRYWFEAPDGTLSPVGRTRTLPATGPDELRLAVVCCSDVTMGWFTAYRHVAETELDLVLHVGDAIYETTKGECRDGGHDGAAVTLDDYRQRHAVTRADPDLQALHLRHPMVFVWDDHDVADNAWRHGAKTHDPDEHGDYEDRLAAAARARHEWIPSRLTDPDDLLDMHRSFAVGDLVELVVTDTRIPGRDAQADEPGAPSLEDPDRTILGHDQRDWLVGRLVDHDRPWALVVTAVTLSPLQLPIAEEDIDALDAALPSGYAVVDGRALCTDEWDGYPAERQQVLRALRRRGSGGVLVSGDIHSSWALEVHDDEGAVAAEFVCPSLTSTPMGHQLPAGTRQLADEAAQEMPHRRWSDLRANGWLHLSVTTDRVRADWYAVPCDRPDPDAHDGPPGTPLGAWEALPTVPAVLQPARGDLLPWPDRGGVRPDWLPPRPDDEPPPSPRRRALLATVIAAAAVAAAVLVVRGRLAHRRG